MMDASIVIFALAGHRLALPADAVRECLPLPELWRRPGTPAAVAGFFSLGGTVLPVIDLAVLLGLREASRSGALVTATQEQDGLYRPLLHVGDVAFLVDRLEQVAQPDAQPDTQPWEGADATAGDPWQHGCIDRHLSAAGAPVALLDPSRILLAEEKARLEMLAQDEAGRARVWDDASDGSAVDPDAA